MLTVWTLTLMMACDSTKDTSEDTERPADFTVSPGVETVTVLNASPLTPLTLYNSNDEALVTLVSDDKGTAHFAYVGAEHEVLDPNNFENFSMADGTVIEPGDGYYIQDDGSDDLLWSGSFSVLDVNDVPDFDFYAEQTLVGIHSSPLTGDAEDPELGFQYIMARDGVLLSAMIRFPDVALYGEPPYPTVIEYSGYSPSRPDRLATGSQIGNTLGYATVSVNMRGTGCSGGVFDVFNRAQHADGYDIVETVARQDWVLNNQVGMVGLSYPGISQLYVGSTNPPSLAAIVPLSTIADAWEMQWPGGIYNSGFTRQWVNARESESQNGGSGWVSDRITNGDTVCENNLALSNHSVDFESFLRAMDTRPEAADARDLNLLVSDIESPVFYGGAFQDEQTGAQYGPMLQAFDQTSMLRVMLTNGRHPDGYSPEYVTKWFEFLEFYVAERVPEMNPLLRAFGASEFGNIFGMEEYEFPEDRFTDLNYEDALDEYESEPTVHVLFEMGAGSEQPGSPIPRYEAFFDTWPPEDTGTLEWFLGADGELLDEPTTSGIDAWTFDEDAGAQTFFGPAGYQLLVPLWDIDWTTFSEGHIASYKTPPFTENVLVSGPGLLEVWVNSPVEEVTLQATLTEIRPDGNETLIQSGWLNLSHREASIDGLDLYRSYNLSDFQPMPVDEWEPATIVIPSVAHAIREGSSLRVSLTTPGRDHGTWEFESPLYSDTPTFLLGYGNLRPSKLTMRSIEGIDIPNEYPPCPSLRGQPCRTFVDTPNQTVE